MKAFLEICKVQDYTEYEKILEVVKHTFDAGQKENPIKPEHTVGIKVNVPGPFSPERAATTCPEILKAVIDVLKMNGIMHIKVFEDCYEKNAPNIAGIRAVADFYNVPFVNLCGSQTVEVKDTKSGTSYMYYKEVLDVDHLISIPKLKTHLLTNYTGAIKNMYGCILKEQRKKFHEYTEETEFSMRLIEIYAIKLPSLVIMDAVVGMDGIGPSHGNAKKIGYVLGSNNGAVIDYFGLKLLNYIPAEVSTFSNALKRELIDLDTINAIEDIYGENTFKLNQVFELVPVLTGPVKQKYIKVALGPMTVNKDTCIKCRVCYESCPFVAIEMEDFPVVAAKKCKYCFCCNELCPNGSMMPLKATSGK